MNWLALGHGSAVVLHAEPPTVIVLLPSTAFSSMGVMSNADEVALVLPFGMVMVRLL
ncbi:MAG: hypothetical protein OXN93_07605 [bacterium]|nr:hypothetical protein [bacterium]